MAEFPPLPTAHPTSSTAPAAARAFAPATVSNVACGFDVLGFAVEGPGDEVIARRRDAPGIEITALTGDEGRLPWDPARNTAGVAVAALLATLPSPPGISLEIHKKMPLASGLGSSAASAVAAVVAVDRLLALGLSREQLLAFALEGERMACGSAHADNAAPCLYGGFVLVRALAPLEIVPLPIPAGLTCALVRPHVEVETRRARQVLGDTVPLAALVRQCGDLAALITGLFRGDLALIARCLVDHVAEPKRADLVPGFREAKAAALAAGALGSSLSGSGPTIFALCADRPTADTVADAMLHALAPSGLAADRLVSAVGTRGAYEAAP